MKLWYTLASLKSRWEEASTMFLTWNRLMALSFGTQRAQLEQRTMAVCPRPCLERPLFRRLDGMSAAGQVGNVAYREEMLKP
mmetsp:Transcript_43621/g.97863  ORF Transcript_43621/g.97863 Transcript_43621/m.97863 type:complete len:82 (-) Transcript_43621:8-253(-)